MPTETAANITTIEDATTVRWLARTLASCRADVAAGPSEEAIDRIRARVLGDAAARKAARKIAA